MFNFLNFVGGKQAPSPPTNPVPSPNLANGQQTPRTSTEPVRTIRAGQGNKKSAYTSYIQAENNRILANHGASASREIMRSPEEWGDLVDVPSHSPIPTRPLDDNKQTASFASSSVKHDTREALSLLNEAEMLLGIDSLAWIPSCANTELKRIAETQLKNQMNTLYSPFRTYFALNPSSIPAPPSPLPPFSASVYTWALPPAPSPTQQTDANRILAALPHLKDASPTDVRRAARALEHAEGLWRSVLQQLGVAQPGDAHAQSTRVHTAGPGRFTTGQRSPLPAGPGGVATLDVEAGCAWMDSRMAALRTCVDCLGVWHGAAAAYAREEQRLHVQRAVLGSAVDRAAGSEGSVRVGATAPVTDTAIASPRPGLAVGRGTAPGPAAVDVALESAKREQRRQKSRQRGLARALPFLGVESAEWGAAEYVPAVATLFPESLSPSGEVTRAGGRTAVSRPQAHMWAAVGESVKEDLGEEESKTELRRRDASGALAAGKRNEAGGPERGNADTRVMQTLADTTSSARAAALGLGVHATADGSAGGPPEAEGRPDGTDVRQKRLHVQQEAVKRRQALLQTLGAPKGGVQTYTDEEMRVHEDLTSDLLSLTSTLSTRVRALTTLLRDDAAVLDALEDVVEDNSGVLGVVNHKLDNLLRSGACGLFGNLFMVAIATAVFFVVYAYMLVVPKPKW